MKARYVLHIYTYVRDFHVRKKSGCTHARTVNWKHKGHAKFAPLEK